MKKYKLVMKNQRGGGESDYKYTGSAAALHVIFDAFMPPDEGKTQSIVYDFLQT